MHTPWKFSIYSLCGLPNSVYSLIDENLWQFISTFDDRSIFLLLCIDIDFSHHEVNKCAIILNLILLLSLSLFTPAHRISRLLNAPTVTKIWLRYYLEQLFGEQWHPRRRPSGGSIRMSRQNSITMSTVRRRSRITYDHEQGARFCRGASLGDKNDCACEDI